MKCDEKGHKNVCFFCICQKIALPLHPQRFRIMKLSEIKRVIGTIATVTGDDNLEIKHLLTDSRELKVRGLEIIG